MSQFPTKCKCPENQVIADGLLDMIQCLQTLSKLEQSGQEQYLRSLQRAHSSIQIYPLPIRKAADAMRLNGVGKKIADRIAFILKTARSQHLLSLVLEEEKSIPLNTNLCSESQKRSYCPKEGSSYYCALVAAFLLSSSDSISKDELVTKTIEIMENASSSQPKSFEWAPVRRKLVSEGLLEEARNDSVPSIRNYRLTTEGANLAKELHAISIQFVKKDENPSFSISMIEKERKTPIMVPFYSTPFPEISKEGELGDEWSVCLLVDKRERGFRDESRTQFNSKLLRLGINCEQYSLVIGDMLWVARKGNDLSKSIVLNYIVERKQIFDLAASIKDLRYFEQKYRLGMSDCKQVFYIVEGDLSTVPQSIISRESLLTAMAMAEVQEQLLVIKTKNVDHSVRFLQCMTENLKEDLKEGRLDLTGRPTLEEFTEKWNSKRFHASPEVVWCKQLQMIRGISIDRAMALQAVYPNAESISEAFKDMVDDEDLVRGLSFLSNGKVSKQFGKACSRRVRDFFRKNDYRSN